MHPKSGVSAYAKAHLVMQTHPQNGVGAYAKAHLVMQTHPQSGVGAYAKVQKAKLANIQNDSCAAFPEHISKILKRLIISL